MRRPKNLKKSPTCFDKTAVFTQQGQSKLEIFQNVCGLLRKAELYQKSIQIPHNFLGKPFCIYSKKALIGGPQSLLRDIRACTQFCNCKLISRAAQQRISFSSRSSTGLSKPVAGTYVYLFMLMSVHWKNLGLNHGQGEHQSSVENDKRKLKQKY